jgi:hypothetical protein
MKGGGERDAPFWMFNDDVDGDFWSVFLAGTFATTVFYIFEMTRIIVLAANCVERPTLH